MTTLFHFRYLLCLAGLIASSSTASAQMPRVLRELLPKAAEKKDTSVEPARRDPTQAQGELKELLNQPEVTANQPSTPTMPPLQIRGRVIGAKKSLVLLSIGENHWLTVQAGQSYLLPEHAGMELKIIAITADQVEVELLPQQRRLLLP